MATHRTSGSDLIYGRLAAWLATHALGDTGLDRTASSLNNIGALRLLRSVRRLLHADHRMDLPAVALPRSASRC